MADLKITDLGAALSVGDSNVTVLDDGTSTMKVTMNQLKEYSIGTTDISGIGNGTPTGAISSVNTSKNNVRDSIAPTETSTASRAYEVDEKMYISDVLYKATRNIALGDSLVPGTNITPANDVSTEIIELKSDASEAIDSVKNIIAPVEDGGTAVLSYSAGDQFIHLGALCKAKTTINAGDTFIINTNYEDAGQVVDQFDSVKQALSNEVTTRAALGAHNFFTTAQGSGTIAGLAVTKNADESFSIAAGTTSGAGFQLPISNVDNYKDVAASGMLPNTNYVFSVGVANANMTLQVFYKETESSDLTLLVSTANVSEVAFTTPSTFKYIYARVYIPISTAVPAMTLKPIIKLATDPSNAFTSRAMTNQQLTDVAQQIQDGYVRKQYASVSVTADGTKTCGTLLYEAAQAMVNVLTGLSDDTAVMLDAVEVGSEMVKAQAVGTYANALLTKTTTAIVNGYFGILFCNATSVFNDLVTIHSTTSASNVVKRSVDGTITNKTSNVLSSGSAVKIYYYVYKKIS